MNIPEISAAELNGDVTPLPPLILLDSIESTNRVLRAVRNARSLRVSTRDYNVLQNDEFRYQFACYYSNRGFKVTVSSKELLLQW